MGIAEALLDQLMLALPTKCLMNSQLIFKMFCPACHAKIMFHGAGDGNFTPVEVETSSGIYLFSATRFKLTQLRPSILEYYWRREKV